MDDKTIISDWKDMNKGQGLEMYKGAGMILTRICI